MNTEYHPHRFGKYAEEQVCKYLQRQKLQLVERNYACRCGEIDLIMRDQDCIVFVEVRARVGQDFRDSLESVDYHKQHKIIRAATYYLQKTGQLNKVFCRFDVMAVKLQNEQLQFHWVKNAFC
ncbi:MAG: YraN family protein [Gammaproteobacteria bacterium]|jgi:putative endonuclease